MGQTDGHSHEEDLIMTAKPTKLNHRLKLDALGISLHSGHGGWVAAVSRRSPDKTAVLGKMHIYNEWLADRLLCQNKTLLIFQRESWAI